jgi:hypothetical protein
VLVRKYARATNEENYRVPFDRSGIFRDRISRSALFLLKRAINVTSDKIDVSRSLKATLAVGGWPMLHNMQRRTNIELVMLVDRGAQRDHIGLLADAVVDRLRAADAFITRYDYRLSPWRLTLISGRPEGPPTQDLSRIAHRHTDHRLLLLTDGEGLFSRGSITIDPLLVREFSRFGQVIMLTPTPPEFWGERVLAAAGVVVVPATEPGLDRAASVVTGDAEEITRKIRRDIPEGFDPFLLRLDRDYHRLSSDKAPPPDDIANLVVELNAWVGSRANFKVLAAIAGFPWLEPGLTLAFGAAVLRQPVSPALFTRLARLPWIRDARMPDWLRIALVNHLSNADRKDVADQVAEVLQRASRRAPGQPLSAEELASLPIAREDSAGHLFSNVDPSALGGLQERVFLSFLKGERLDPFIPLTPEATEDMKREIGAGFVRRQMVFAGLALLLSAVLFVYRDALVGLLDQAELVLAGTTGGLLSVLLNIQSEPQRIGICRVAALAMDAAALIAWAWSAAREPELASAQRTFRPTAWIPGFAALQERFAKVTRIAWKSTRQDEWSALAGLGLGLAFLALGSKDVSGRLVLLASLLTLVWVYWVRLRIAGAATSLHLDFDSVEVCDSQNRCVVKPGGLAAYPLGRSIADGRWLLGSLGIVAIPLPTFIAMGWGFALSSDVLSASSTAVGAAITIVGLTITLALARRVILGAWAVPDRTWDRSLTPLGDILFATTLVTLFVAAFWMNATSHATEQSDAKLSVIIMLLGATISTVFVSVPLIGLRLRTGGKTLYSGLLFVTVITATAAEVAAFLIYYFTTGIVETVAIICIWCAYPVALIGSNLFATFRIRRSRGLELESVRPLRQRALAAALFCLGVFDVMIASGFFAESSIGTLMTGLSKLDIVPPFVSTEGLFFVYMTTAIACAIFAPVYPVWRYVGPAAISIEQLKLQGRLRPLAKPVGENPARAFWDTSWAALPCVAFFGLDIDWPLIGHLPGLAPLAIPVAVLFAKRHGHDALLPILLGTLLMWFAVRNVGPFATHGGAWPAVVVMFWTHFTIDSQFRTRLLQRERLSWRDVAVFAAFLSISIGASTQMKNGGIITFNVDPSAVVVTLAIVVGASRMPRERLAVAIIAMAILWFVVHVGLHQTGNLSSNIKLVVGLEPWTAIIAGLAVVWIDPYRRIEGRWRDDHRGDQGYLARASSAVFSNRPFLVSDIRRFSRASARSVICIRCRRPN